MEAPGASYTIATQFFLGHELLVAPVTQPGAQTKLVIIPPGKWTNFWDDKSEYAGDSLVREYLVPLFAHYGVTIVFNGHNHDYQRGFCDGVHYVITGGAGGAIDTNPTAEWGHMEVVFFEHHFTHVSMKSDSLLVSAIDMEGKELEHFTVNSSD